LSHCRDPQEVSKKALEGFWRILREEKSINVAVFIPKILLYFKAVIELFFRHCHEC
jgi:hypothetical protein